MFPFKPLLVACLFFLFSGNLNAQDWKQHNQNMMKNFQSGKLKAAIVEGEKAASLIEKDSSLIYEYAGIINNLSFLYLSNHQYTKSIKGYNIVLGILKPAVGKEHKFYLKSLCFQGEAYMHKGQLDSAETIFFEALNTRKRVLDKKDLMYIYSYILVRKLFVQKKEYEKAHLYQDTVIQLTENADGEYHPNHLIELSNKADIYEKEGNLDEAIQLWKLLVEQYQKLDEISENSLGAIHILGNLYRKKGNYDEAINTFELVTQKKKEKYGKSSEYAMSLSTTGVIIYEKGDFDKAARYYSQAKKILQEIEMTKSPDYAKVLNNQAVLLYSLGNYYTAEQYYLKAKRIREETIGTTHPDYLQTINGLAVLYQESGNYEKAEPLYLSCLKLYDNNKVVNENYFTILTNLGGLYHETYQMQKAADIYKKAQSAGKQLYGLNNPTYAKILKRIANYYKTIELYELSDTFYTSCLLSIEKSIGKNNWDYAGALNNRGALYLKLKKYSKAEKDLLESAKIYREIYGDYHYQYSVAQNNLASLYFELGDKQKCQNYLVRANENLINKINESLGYMTGQESEAFFKSTNYLFDVYYSYYYIEKEKTPKLSTFAYDNALARKGLLLQSEKTLRMSVLETGDSSLINDYKEFIKIKELQAKQFSAQDKYTTAQKKELLKRSENLEKKLATNSSIFESRQKIRIAGWKDVKKSLQKSECAIEFIRFRYYNLDKTANTYYCALILRSDKKTPIFQYLFKEEELTELIKKDNNETDHEYIARLHHKTNQKQLGLKPDNDTTSNKLDSLIWRPIEKHLSKIKTIFYSLSGELHKVSIAALSVNDSTFVSDKYNLNTLISTRNILEYKRVAKEWDYKVSLYGGIDFDATIDETETNINSEPADISINENNKITQEVVSRNQSGSLKFLRGTLKETKIIEELFKDKKANVKTYIGKYAIEEKFKQYRGDIISPNIIHIATHGFFFPTPDKDAFVDDFFVSKNKFKHSKNPLLRSGLFFAGANRAWYNQKPPKNKEDGILTAYEVSNTNLSNTELVVLSACQTGLGDIKGSEGVYGLQRSFKIAGAEYVVMSLWKIPDEQTVELMKFFYTYKNLNLTIPEAFNRAQDEMKKKYLPYYWAGFVLIK